MRLLTRYAISLASLAAPAAITAICLHRPHTGPIVSFAFVVDIAAVSWWAGFWAGALVTAGTIPVIMAVATHGHAIFPPRFDAAAISVMLLIALLASRVAAAQQKAKSLLRSANRELDERVRERTRELENARESLQITLASIGDAVIATRNDGCITLLNGVAEALTGWSAAEAVGRPLDEVFVIVNAGTRATVESPVSKVLRSGSAVGLANHTLLIARDGREIPIDDSGAPIRAAGGEVAGVVLTFRDISERYEADAERQKLLDADERLVGILANINDGFLIVDREWRLTYANRKASELLKRSAEEILGANLWTTFPAMAGTPAQSDLENGMRESLPVRCVFHHDASHTWLELGSYPTRDGLALLMRDITQNQRLELQLRQAQKMEAVGRLAGGIAHDFNNLLTVINGYAELALLEIPTDLRLHETLTEVLSAGRRAAELTNGLLAFSRKQIRQPSVLKVSDTVRGMEKMLRRVLGEDIEVVTALAEDLWQIEADRNQLEQIVLNLAVNARDAMPGGGILTIETSNIALDGEAGQRLNLNAGDYIQLAMSDNGQGMDANTQVRIFEPFFTTKGPGKGTGLGLATVYGIVTQGGGAISVYSELGHGTAFKIYLPRLKDAVSRDEPERRAAVPAVPRGDRRTILMVEDDESVRRLALAMLERHGYRVFPAASGAEAIARCRAENGAIDLVLSDMVMPQMNGEQLAVELLKEFPKLKFLFMSGYTEHAVVNQALLKPGVSFVGKPFTADVLIGRVNQAMGNSEQAASG